MELKRVLAKVENYRIEIAKESTFNIDEGFEQYKELFKKMKDKGYVRADSFKDSIWYVHCNRQYRWIRFDYSLEEYSSFVPSLKAYTLILRNNGKKAKTIHTKLKYLKDVIKSTNGLKELNDVRDYFLGLDKSSAPYHKGKELINYISFYPLPHLKNEMTDLVNSLNISARNNRDLPLFDDILTFNNCVNDYFSSLPIEITIRYYPIFLWWLITNIIPMRAIEFLRIKIDCLTRKEDNSFWITIPRFKVQSTSPDETHWYQQVQINQHTYNLINDYVLWLVNMGVESEYLIPPLDWINDRFKPSRITTENVENDDKFSRLIDFFYDDIVEATYGESNLEKITPGDTRHFSIINMFLQGFNILSISRLAGHQHINSPSNYYTHAKHFAESFVYKLAQSKMEGEIGHSISDGFIGLRSRVVERYKVGLDTEAKTTNWLKVDYGYCRDVTNFPNNCVEDCRLCEDYYSFKPTVNDYNNGLKWLESYSKELNQNISKTIDMMATISFDTYEILKGKDKINESEGRSLAIQLFKYIDHKALIDSRIMEEKYRDE
ncbi:hypothetical protein SFC66_04535 [Terribacillus saccharophilus]|uniref:hypothetical protein n=1 Tax=Terribacillus saccharophilus TaxID=361277 RepID=UPI0039822A54